MDTHIHFTTPSSTRSNVNEYMLKWKVVPYRAYMFVKAPHLHVHKLYTLLTTITYQIYRTLCSFIKNHNLNPYWQYWKARKLLFFCKYSDAYFRVVWQAILSLVPILINMCVYLWICIWEYSGWWERVFFLLINGELVFSINNNLNSFCQNWFVRG